jgi:hypothetical protein
MNKRGTAMAVLVLCVLGGLIAAIFTPAIAATLTVSATPGTTKQVASGVTATATPQRQPTVPITAATTVAGSATAVPTAQPTMPAGVIMLAQDNFQRPDQVGWGTSSGQRPWGSDASTNPAFAIVQRAGQIAASSQSALQATLNVTSADAEILVQGSVSQFDAQGITNLGVVLRWQDTNNWYKALIDGSTIQLLKDVNGKVTVLAEHVFKATSGAVNNLRFRVQGSNLFAKAWALGQTEPATWTIMNVDPQFTTGISGVRVKEVSGVIIRIIAFLETSVANT